MSRTAAILALDVKGVMRDNVMLYNLGFSVVGMIAITVIGLGQGQDPAWAAWFPFLVILALIGNPAAYGFLFGLLMVEERECGVRSALAVAPVRPTQMLAIRTLVLTAIMVVWPLITVLVMNSTWRALFIPPAQLLTVIVTLAVIAPLTSLGVAAYASNKIEAIAIFKGLNFVVLAPLVLKFIPEDAPFRLAFLISPSGWGYMSFDAFVAGDAGRGYALAAGGVVYSLALLALAVRYYIQSTYKTLD